MFLLKNIKLYIILFVGNVTIFSLLPNTQESKGFPTKVYNGLNILI